MGSRNNPGKYDCLSKAEPDEPMFVLLGRDPCAPLLVTLWADIRARMGEEQEKVEEANACADAMAVWIAEHDKGPAQVRALDVFTDEVIWDYCERGDRIAALETLVREMREQLVWCKGKMAVPATDWFKGPQLILEHSKELVP